MPYNNFSVIGYHEHTGWAIKVADAVFTKEEEKTDSTVGVNYTAVRALKNDVAKKQLLNFGRVVELARKKINANSAHSADTTLKLFVAPEFLFKAPDQNERNLFAFSHEDRDMLIKALAHMFSKPAYKDWVIAPGTIMWEWKLPSPRVTRDGLLSYAAMNTGIIIDGGNNRYVSCTKHYASISDGIDNSNAYPQNALTHSDKEIIYEKAKDLVLEKDGRRMAMEICRDHDYPYMVLKKSMLGLGIDTTDSSTTTTTKPLDFHVLIAASMSLIRTSVVAKTNGYVIRCDGSGNLDAKAAFEVCKINSQRYRRDAALVEEAYWSKSVLEDLKKKHEKYPKDTSISFTSKDKKDLDELSNMREFVAKQSDLTTLDSPETIAERHELPEELYTRKPRKVKPSLLYSDLVSF